MAQIGYLPAGRRALTPIFLSKEISIIKYIKFIDTDYKLIRVNPLNPCDLCAIAPIPFRFRVQISRFAVIHLPAYADLRLFA